MVDLKEPNLLLRDVSSEKLDEVHGSGYYDYLSCPEYTSSVTASVGRMIRHHGGVDPTVLDVGCGTGWLSRFVPPPMEYFGFDASRAAIVKAWELHGELDPQGPRSFNTMRIEQFLDTEVLFPFDVIHFGGVLYCLIKPEDRIGFVERYIEKLKARFIVISELELFDSAPLKERFELIEGETFHLNMKVNNEAKNHRKVEIYRTGVQRDG